MPITAPRLAAGSLAALCAIAILPATALAEDIPDLVERVGSAVVQIQVHSGGGTGFFAERADRVVTAFHVIDEAREIVVRTRDGEEHEAHLVAFDRKADVALLGLEAPVEGVEPLSLAEALPRVGESAYTVGQPLVEGDGPTGVHEGLLRWSFSEGRISALGERRIQTTVTLQPGNSGGPLFDADGLVHGVVVSGYGEFGLATPANVVADLAARPPMTKRRVPVSFGSIYGMGFEGLPGAVGDRRARIGLRVEANLVIDRRLVVGLALNGSWLGKSSVRKGTNPDQRMEVGILVGPSLDLPWRPKGGPTFVLQPYLIAGVLLDRQGTRSWSVQQLDPNCDPIAGLCATENIEDLRWQTDARMLIGGGVRLLAGPAVFSVDVGTSPTRPGEDFRIGLGLGVRFGGP